MTFQQAFAALKRAYPSAPIGKTAAGGRYRNRAERMTFERHPSLANVYRAYSERGKEMWLYYSEARDRICCGDEDR